MFSFLLLSTDLIKSVLQFSFELLFGLLSHRFITSITVTTFKHQDFIQSYQYRVVFFPEDSHSISGDFNTCWGSLNFNSILIDWNRHPVEEV